MFSPMAHFSLTRVTDRAKLDHENDLHLLYHRPQLLSLTDVAWGDRWMRDADCAALGERADDFDLDFAAMYWFRPPRHQSGRAFSAHFARASQLGLGSDDWTQVVLDEFMVPLKGYARHDRLVSADALPFRPMKGAYLAVSRFHRHQDVAAEAAFHWYDQVRVPAMLECAGAAGAWTFASRELFSPTGNLSNPIIRVTVVYLDGDPVSFSRELAERDEQTQRSGLVHDTSEIEERLFAGPLRMALPWRPGKFDTSGSEKR